jgi:apolipoprotein N-acyltransferase
MSSLHPRAAVAVALVTAVLWWLAGQRWGLFALGWVALAPLFRALCDLNWRARWRLGHLTGFFSFALINWWIVPTIARASPVIGVPSAPGALLGIAAVAIIAAVHGLQVALVAVVWSTRGWPGLRWTRSAPWLVPIAVAVLWAVLDALRYETVLAHGWGALAYTQWRDTALLQSASVVGQHGLTALCVWFAASLALWARRRDAILWRAPLLVFVALHAWGAWRLSRPVRSSGELRVLLIQTAVSSLSKSDMASGESPFEQARRLTRENARRGQFDLIVWPETTASVYDGASSNSVADTGAGSLAGGFGGQAWVRSARLAPRQMPGHDPAEYSYSGDAGWQMRAIEALSRELRTPVLSGMHTMRGVDQLRNDAVLVEPDGRKYGSGKQRLVPFGERAPWSEVLPFLRRLAPQPAVSPATSVNPLPLAAPRSSIPGATPDTATSGAETVKAKLGTIICFESCFRYPARALCRSGAQALFVLTNDEWFSGTNAPWEHAAMLTVRAVENEVAVAQAANGGYSFAVDPRGRFVIDVSHSFGAPRAVKVVLPLP